MMELKPNNKYFTFNVEAIVKKTEKAFLVQIDGERYWFPKSCCLGWNDGVNKTIALPYFIANNNGLLNKNWNGTDAHAYTCWFGHQLKEYLEEHGLKF